MEVDTRGEITNKPWAKRASLLPRKTYSGESKIVYKRAPRKGTIRDINRMMTAWDIRLEEDAEKPVKWVWWMEILNTVMEEMIGRVAGLVGIDNSYANALWYFIMSSWQSLVTKVFPGDTYASTILTAFEAEFKQALKTAIEKGDKTLLDKLLAKILKGG